MKERNYEVELRRKDVEIREARLEKEKYQENLRRELKLSKEWLERIRDNKDGLDEDAVKAIAKRVLKILDKYEI